MLVEETDMTKGAKLSLTFKEGLVIQVMPNGDIVQQLMKQEPLPKCQTKGSHLVQDVTPEAN